MNKKLKYLSLFSGMGGFDYGVESAGFSNIGCIELDKDACEHLKLNTDWRIYENDINDVSTDEVIKKSNISYGQLDLLIGGPPCQSYSKSSFWSEATERGYDDSRGKLINQYMRFVENLLPKVFIIENVPGFLFQKQNKGFLTIIKFLKKIEKKTGYKYSYNYKVLNCADYGIPQKRERLFFVANRLNVNFCFPSRTHAPRDNYEYKEAGLLPHKTVGDAIGNLKISSKELADCAIGGKWSKLLPCIPPGKNYQYFTEKDVGKNIFKYRSRYWTFLLKLHPYYPSWTIQSSPGPSTGPFHWDNRKLSIREMARIQTIPDYVRFASNRRVTQRLIGNAVPSAMGEILAMEIKKQIFGLKKNKEIKLLPEKLKAKIRTNFSRSIPEQYLN